MSNSMYEWSTFPQPEFIDRSRLWNMKSVVVSQYVYAWVTDFWRQGTEKVLCVCISVCLCAAVSVWKKSMSRNQRNSHYKLYMKDIISLFRMSMRWLQSSSLLLECMCVCVSRPLRESCLLYHVLGASVIRTKIRKKEWKRKKTPPPSFPWYIFLGSQTCVCVCVCCFPDST